MVPVAQVAAESAVIHTVHIDRHFDPQPVSTCSRTWTPWKHEVCMHGEQMSVSRALTQHTGHIGWETSDWLCCLQLLMASRERIFKRSAPEPLIFSPASAARANTVRRANANSNWFRSICHGCKCWRNVFCFASVTVSVSWGLFIYSGRLVEICFTRTTWESYI